MDWVTETMWTLWILVLPIIVVSTIISGNTSMSDAGPANTSVSVPELTFGDLSATVAAELAAGLSSPETIRKRFGLSLPQWKHLTQNTLFRGMVKDALKSFQGDLNAGRTIVLKSEIMLEDSLADLYGIVKDRTVPSGERIKAVQTMAELAGRGKGSVAADPNAPKAAGFTLNIHVGDGKNVVIQGSTDGQNQRDI